MKFLPSGRNNGVNFMRSIYFRMINAPQLFLLIPIYRSLSAACLNETKLFAELFLTATIVVRKIFYTFIKIKR